MVCGVHFNPAQKEHICFLDRALQSLESGGWVRRNNLYAACGIAWAVVAKLFQTFTRRRGSVLLLREILIKIVKEWRNSIERIGNNSEKGNII